MTEQMRFERQSQTSRWIEIDAEEAERLITRAATLEQKVGRGKWMLLTADQIRFGLGRGAEPRYGTDWYMRIRRVHEFSPEAARAAADLEKRVEASDRRLAGQVYDD